MRNVNRTLGGVNKGAGDCTSHEGGGMSISWRYIGNGFVRVRVNGGEEFAVHCSRWRDRQQRHSIIAAECCATSE